MRTLTLIASLGLLAAAESPKPTPAKLTTAEVISLNVLGKSLEDLKKQAEELQKQQRQVVADACTRAGIAMVDCEIKPDGEIAKRAAPEQKK